MAEHLIIKGETKEELYATLLPQLKSLVEGESDIIANMANIAALIWQAIPDLIWAGFDRFEGDRFSDAAELFEDVALGDDFPTFLTVPAYSRYLVDN